MTGTQLATLIRYYTKTDSTVFTDANMLILVNSIKDDFASQITERNENFFIIPQTQNLVASSVTAREYALPDDLLNDIQTVEAALDSTQSTAFINVTPYPGGFSRLSKNIG